MRVVLNDIKGRLGAEDGKINPDHEPLWYKNFATTAAPATPLRKTRTITKSAGKWSTTESLFGWAMRWLPNGRANMANRKGLGTEKRAAIFNEWRKTHELKEERSWYSMEQHHRDMKEAETPITYQTLQSEVGTATAALIIAEAAQVVAQAKAEVAADKKGLEERVQTEVGGGLVQQGQATIHVGKGKGRADSPNEGL